MNKQILEEVIKERLKKELSSVYCNNCSGLTGNGFEDEFEGYDQCDDCHRKYMNWGIGKKTLDNLTESILSDERLSNVVDSTVTPVDKWISVEDRLPKKMDYYWVNVANETELYQTKAIYSKDHGGWVTDVGTVLEDVTDWMPLPQPPTPHNPSKEGE